MLQSSLGAKQQLQSDFNADVVKWHILNCADLSFRNGTECCNTLQRHCTENSKQRFPEMELRGFGPNSYNYVSVSDLYIPTIGYAYSAAGKYVNRS
jgi:hypothetical protein